MQTPINTPATTIMVDAVLWKSMKFLVEGLAIMGTVRLSSPALHSEVVKLARILEANDAEKSLKETSKSFLQTSEGGAKRLASDYDRNGDLNDDEGEDA